MMVSFKGIGQWAATFVCTSDVTEGQMVKVGGSGEAAVCADGDKFCGMALAVARDGGACSVALGGMVTVPYTGTAPALGWSGLSADAGGGVKADTAGREYLVVDVDSTGMLVTFAL